MPRQEPQIAPVERITYTLKEAAAAARVSERTLQRAMATGQLNACRISSNRCTRIRVEDLKAWIDGHVTTGQEAQ